MSWEVAVEEDSEEEANYTSKIINVYAWNNAKCIDMLLLSFA